VQAQAAAVFAEVEEHIVKLRRAVVGHRLREGWSYNGWGENRTNFN